MHPRGRYRLIPEVFVVIFHDGNILLGQRANTGYNDGNWGLPGGHGEDKETVREGAAREAKEELGIEIKPEDLELVLVQNRWCNDPDYGHARIGFYFAPKKFGGEISNKEPEKCSELNFFSLNHLPENIVPHVRSALIALEEGCVYDEFDWDTLKL